ncbi:hypothetical protein ACIQXI_07835 [Lysinibacillus sp. NPDC097195]|uniref:hypothetical protein n=1 Tax=Lysinibacillus sp. NPDC097195 TaxID=3364141 RepID=UPI003814560C
MNNLKQQLKQELRTDVPFTEDMKQRMLMPNRPIKIHNKKQHWQVPLIALTFILILGFVLKLQFTPQETISAKAVATLPTDPYDLVKLMQKNETVLPIIESKGKLVIDPSISFIMGKQYVLSHLPMVVDPDAKIEVGDYIAYSDKVDTIVSPVFGIEGDKVQTSNGQVTLNGEYLALPGAVAPVHFAQSEQQDIYKYYFNSRFHMDGAKMQTIDVNLAPLQEHEYAVYMNKKGGTVEVVNDEAFIGKVIGVKKLEPTFTLTAKEQTLYNKFKENYDLSVLKGVKPLSIAKMYAISEAQGDYLTHYSFLAEHTRLEIEQYIAKQKIKNYYFTNEIQMLISAYNYNGIEKAKFEQLNETQGTIIIPIKDFTSSINFVKNEQGVWHPTTK